MTNFRVLPRDCLELLGRADGKRFRHSTSGTIVWSFGTLVDNEAGASIIGLSATAPGNYAEDLSRYSSIPLAQSEDGDLLMCDLNANGKVEILRHEDMSLENIGPTISQWLSEAASCDANYIEGDRSDVPESLIWRWHPSHSPVLDQSIVDDSPDIEIKEDGTCPIHWTWPTETTDHYRCWFDKRENLLRVNFREDVISYGFDFSDDNQLILTGPDCDHDVVYERVT